MIRILVEVHEENLASQKYTTGKGQAVFIGSSNNCGHFSLTLHQSWTSGSFVKVSCSVEPEALSMNFSYFVTLESVGLSCTVLKQIIFVNMTVDLTRKIF